VLGTGYLDLYARINSVDEWLVDYEPLNAVCEGAIEDRLRLLGSTMKNAEVLASTLHRAVQSLCPETLAYIDCLAPPPGGPAGNHESAQQAVAVNAQIAARAALRQVRHSINEFIEAGYGGIVRARDLLLITILATGVVTDLLAIVAVWRHVPTDFAAAAAVYFLVAAGVGLLNALYTSSQSGSAIEDYGLSTVRLIATPLISGLAGVVGVAAYYWIGSLIVQASPPLEATLPLTATSVALSHTPPAIANPSVTPTSLANPPSPVPTAPTPPASLSAGLPALNAIYSLSPASLLVAALFGLAPNLLIAQLQNRADQYKRDIQSSSTADGKPAS
jgi:hypothetical protein